MLEVFSIIGKVTINTNISMEVVNRFITFIWSCTNFLVPKINGWFYPSTSSKKAILYMEE